MSQYATLGSLLAGWRADFGQDAVVLWAVAYPGSEPYAQSFAGSSQEPLFADSGYLTAYSAFNASKDDLFIIGKSGAIEHTIDLGNSPLSQSQGQVDSWVRGLLQE